MSPSMKLQTVYKVIQGSVDPLLLFSALREQTKGQTKKKEKHDQHAFLLESADHHTASGEKTIGCTHPSLRIAIKDSLFVIEALNDVGEAMLLFMRTIIPVHELHEATATLLRGTLPSAQEFADEEERLKQIPVFQLIRKIAFAFAPTLPLPMPFCGLFGAISYDAIDYVEQLPASRATTAGSRYVPDFLFYYATEMFIIDHQQQKTYIFASAPANYADANRVEGSMDRDAHEAFPFELMNTLQQYEKTISSIMHAGEKLLPEKKSGTQLLKASDVEDATFARKVEQIQEHIHAGDVFQCVLSRVFSVACDEDPLHVYARLKSINPGPYMFFIEDAGLTLLGSSPETCLKVTGGHEKTVEIKPIAGTLPCGKKNRGSATEGRKIEGGEMIDHEMDSRLELDLLLNEKELAEHCMLIDLARNDIARVSVPGTRTASRLLQVEKYSHVQHLVSTVTGTLRPDLDALHAYAATMNMGTLTGAPKIKAMELIRHYEPEKRGFYGGAACYLTPAGEFDSCIIIRAMVIAEGIATVRAGAGIVYDSQPLLEAEETRKKAAACLMALGVKP
ncbi:anthranilate synthase component 1 [Candidatus Woesearchaeota archaeon]|nr:anthranilate synthase component 1 [Candidatus Woesearchaeota archaeon]